MRESLGFEHVACYLICSIIKLLSIVVEVGDKVGVYRFGLGFVRFKDYTCRVTGYIIPQMKYLSTREPSHRNT